MTELKDTYYLPNFKQTVDGGEFSSERDLEISALKKMAGKNNNAFMMGMRNLDEPVPLGMFDGYLKNKSKDMGIELKSSGWEATKGAFEGVVKAPVRWAGYAATNTLPLIAKTATSLYALSGAAGGVESADKWLREANKGIEAWYKEVQSITGIEDASMAESIVGNALGSVWGSVGIGGVFGGASVAPMFGVSAFQDTYTRQREAGTGIGESLVRGTVHGAGEWYFERLQLNRIFGALAKKSKPIAIVKDLLENAMQEGVQQATEQAANWNIDNHSLIEKLQEIGASMVGGAVASLGGSVGGNILNRKTIDEVGDLMKKTGHTDEEIANVKNELSKIVDTDELQQAANNVAKDELTTVALTYKEQAQAASEELVNQLDSTISRNELVDMPSAISGEQVEMPPLYQLGELQVDTEKNPALGMVLYQAEQAGKPFQTLGQVLEWTKGKLDVDQAQKMSTGINSVYSNTYEALKGIGQDDVLADTNARIRSAQAFAIARNYGMSVEEADNMLGGITSQRAGEFQGRAAAQFQDVAQRINEIDAEEQANGVPEYTAPTININGVERQTTNSDGEPIAKSEKSLRYFYNWFGDSKVVDEQGRPLSLFRGDLKDIEIFDETKQRGGNLGRAFYFTTDKEYARQYSGYNETGREPREYYLKLNNPLIVGKEGYVRAILNNFPDAGNLNTQQQIKEFLQDKGIDGVIWNRGNKVEYAVYSPNQIKSTSNRGTYSLTENNIYYQDEYEVKKVDKDQNLSEFRNKNEEYNKKAKDYFGTTYRMAEAGYILTDGELLDFSGKKFGGTTGQRTMDHRQVNEIDVSMEDFINSGNIRFMPEGDKILMSNYPTQKQFDMIRRAVGLSRGTFTVELMSDAQKWGMNRNDFYGEYEYGTPFTKIKRDIDAFYKGAGVRPEMAFYQSAYAGSRVDYDRPSLEAIGSGEGTAAHGYGLYYALNKDVAEGYRKRFSMDDRNVTYKGKDINDYYEEGDYVTFGALNALIDAELDLDVAIKSMKQVSEINKSSQYYDEDIYNETMAIYNKLKEFDIKDIKETKTTGQVHEVDVPEVEFLMDEDEQINNQSDVVRRAVREIMNENPNNYTESENYESGSFGEALTGKSFYGELMKIAERNGVENRIDQKKYASKVLEEHGIKGITYDGQQDGRCFVIFNPDDVKVIQKFYQDESNPRGAYYNNTVYLFENADESTFVHEMAHSYMDVVERLAQGGNAQAQRDLNVISKWLGRKQGEAFTQADWERFARGFEMYMREGKSPNEYLGGTGGVFDKFKNWLMNIYAGIRNLTVTNEKGKQEPVKINQQIKDFYDEMLGGQDIDKVLDTAEKNQQAMNVLQSKLDELADAQRVLAEERSRLVREMANSVKPDSTWANVKDWGKNVLESAKDLPSNVLQSSYERLAKIDPRLGLLVQKIEQSQGLRLKKWADEIQPFYEAFNKLSAEDKAKVQFYLLNQQWGDVEDIIGKDSTEAVQKMLKEVYEELVASGVEVGYRDNYFPRAVLDYDGLLQEMGLTYPALRKEMEEAIGKDATPEQQAEWLDKHIMGFKGNVSLNQNRNTKERKLDLITDTMAKYYKPSMETLVDYMDGMAKLLSMREAFGRDIEYKESTAEDSIGKIINNMLGDNKLTKKEIDEVRQVLSALYLPNGMGNKFLQAMRQYGYATKLSYSTTVRQFADIGMMMKVNGVLNTLDALFHPDKRITLESLGIDPLGEEFQTSKKDVGGKIANIATKWKGINWADAVMKNAFMRGNYKSLQQLAKTPDKFHQKYDALFGDETDTLIKDLNDNKLSEPVKVLLFHEISKIQPISRSAMPTAYLSNPNGRVFYMFKTFSLHRAEYMVSELAEDFRRGDLKKAGKDIMADVAVIGWEGLVELLIAFLKYGWQAFALNEVIDTFMGSGLGVLGLNKHQALQITRGQIGDFFQQMVGVGTPFDDIGYMIRHYDDEDKLLRAFLPDMIVEPLIAGPKPISNKKKSIR